MSQKSKGYISLVKSTNPDSRTSIIHPLAGAQIPYTTYRRRLVRTELQARCIDLARPLCPTSGADCFGISGNLQSWVDGVGEALERRWSGVGAVVVGVGPAGAGWRSPTKA